MTDLIKRSDAIDALNECEDITGYGYRQMHDALMEIPSVDISQGENLLEKYPSLFECSVCGASCFDTIPWDCNINYCPNCGAKMSNASNASNTLATLEKGETK